MKCESVQLTACKEQNENAKQKFVSVLKERPKMGIVYSANISQTSLKLMPTLYHILFCSATIVELKNV